MDVGVVVVVPQAKATSTRTASGINIFLIIFPPLQKYKKIWIYFASIHEVGRFANLQALNRILNHQIKCLSKRRHSIPGQSPANHPLLAIQAGWGRMSAG
jgi:hypothetical protein